MERFAPSAHRDHHFPKPLRGDRPRDAPNRTAFGVAFRAGAGAAAKGAVTVGAGPALSPGHADHAFHYLGLSG